MQLPPLVDVENWHEVHSKDITWTSGQTHRRTDRCNMLDIPDCQYLSYLVYFIHFIRILVGVQADVTHETWVGVLQQIDISGGGNPESFLPKAVSFANDKCWGTLSCARIVDLVTQKTNATAVDTAIADLRYGSVNVNLPTILGYAVMKMAWGGFPGSTPQVMLWQSRWLVCVKVHHSVRRSLYQSISPDPTHTMRES